MKFDDEHRPHSLASSAKRERFLADIDQYVFKFEELEALAAGATAERDVLRRRAKEQSTRLSALSRERDRLAKENEELKSKLIALRSSARYRVGTKLTAPGRLVRQALSFPQQGTVSRTADSPLQVASTRFSKTSASTAQSPLERRVTLLSAFEEKPSKQTLYSVLAHDYFTLGNALEAAKLIEAHRALLTQLSPPEQRTVDAIEGLARLFNRKPSVPPVQPTPGYDPERNRWLYCAHSVAPYNSNGYSTRTKGLIGGMSKAGMDVIVAARPGYPWDVKTDIAPIADRSFTENIDGVDHVFSRGASWTQSSLDHYFQQSADAYVQTARRYRVEGIHAASNHVTAFPALLAARRLGVPFVYEVRGLWEVTEASSKPGWSDSERYRFAHEMETLVAAEADQVLAITEQVKEELVARGVAAAKIQILPNAVDTDQFSEMPPHAPTAAKLRLKEDVPVIGYAGSIVAYEGLDVLLRSLKVLQERGIEAQCVIVGDGPELPALQTLAQSLELSSVTFPGRVPPADIANYISVFDIMPCPRRDLPVTQMVPPLKPFEAMAAAKAVVLSDLAPLRSLAGPNQTRARLFNPDDPLDLAEQLAELVSSREKRQEMGRRARLWVVRERTWDTVSRIAVASDRAALATRGAKVGPAKRLSDVRIGIIADEFTYAGLAPECELLRLGPETWRTQLSAVRIDALLVESAWEGNDGKWHRKVGYYDAESFEDLAELTAYCRDESIPTLFWNKEDPVHFNRFQKTAEYFDHVFTSDDGSIGRYLGAGGPHQKTVASVPFYAQPRLHNPLPGNMKYSHSVCYAGSFYGERYKKRSAELEVLLRAAASEGLTIYDRQYDNPESPYKFPPALSKHVQGGLAYTDMIDAYKAHPVHVNVNSVDDSGTMLSRRVFEIAASGGAIISGPGRGAESIFGGIVPVTADQPSAQDVLGFWMAHEPERNRDAWLGLRTVLRSHTAAHRLAFMLRTAGMVVDVPTLPSYGVVVETLTEEVAQQLLAQSHRPSMVIVTREELHGGGKQPDALASIPVVRTQDWEAEMRNRGCSIAARVPQGGLDRVFFEDLLASKRFAQWRYARIDRAVPEQGQSLASLVQADHTEWDVMDIVGTHKVGDTVLVLRREVNSKRTSIPSHQLTAQETQKVVVAGHDLKFAGALIDHLQHVGHRVEIDQWHGHSSHDEEASTRLLSGADVILCEWALGNAVWYSKHKLPHQRLVCRLHLQEVDTAYLSRINLEAVDLFVFVGEQIRDRAVRDFGFPSDRCTVIPNFVDTNALDLPKNDDARWRLGLVGIVPQRKRLDLALDLLRILRMEDRRYCLAVKGKRPEDYPWMSARAEEMEFYQRQFKRIEEDPLLTGAVTFDGHGDDMREWYQKIGTALSVSDFESFHLTLADGAASGAVAQSLAWAGVDQIYPPSWVHASVEEMASDIFVKTSSVELWQKNAEAARRFAQKHFAVDLVLPQLERAILHGCSLQDPAKPNFSSRR